MPSQLFETTKEIYQEYEKVCNDYGIKPNENIKKQIKEKVEWVIGRNSHFYHVASTSMDSMDQKYPEYKGQVRINTILEKRNEVHFHMLIIWDEHGKRSYVLYPIKQGE